MEILRTLAAASLLAAASAAYAGGGPAETVVLLNESSADSKRVAEHYAKARGIPASQICTVKCTTSLESPITDFVRDVADPLRVFLRKNGMEDRVRFVVLTQGMPIRARTPGGDVSTAAALSLLDSPLCGADSFGMRFLPNPYRSGTASSARAGESRMLLVTALLSTTADEAVALVDRSVASDGTAPAGSLFVFQDAAGNAGVRNGLYDAARANLEARGFKTEHTKAGAAEVAGRKRVMGYMAGGSYSALTPDGVKSNEYLPGAICDHLQSFGAVPQNFGTDASKHTQFPVTHMVRAGITGVHGAVQEPYAHTFPAVDLFDPYTRGYTLAETFHQSLPFLYWMNLTLGDPLCAPYAVRPKVEAKADTSRAADGVVALTASAPGAVRIEVFAGGRRVGAADGAEFSGEFAAAHVAAGAGEILVEATGPGEHEPRGWATLRTSVKSAPPAPADPAAAARVMATAITLEGPAEVVAGESFDLKVTPAAAGPWKGRVEVRSAVPPVRFLSKDVDASAAPIALPLTWQKAGAVEITVTLPDDGTQATHRFRVRAAAPRHATTPLARVPSMQVVDIPVVVEDAFGNAAEFDGEMSLAVPGDPGASVPAPVKVVKGRGVFRDVVFTRAGRQTLVFSGPGGTRMSADGEGIDLTGGAVRAWLVSSIARGEAAAKLFASDFAGADREGASAAGVVFRRQREGDDVVDLAGAAADGDACAAIAVLDPLTDGKVTLLAAAPGRLRVLLDGKEVFDGVPKTTDPNGKREAIAEVTLRSGTHFLVVVAERKGRHAFALEIAGEGGARAPVVVRAGERDRDPASHTVSGRVRRGPQNGVGGVKVSVTGADGKERAAVSGPDGWWFVEGVPVGDVTARAMSPGATPAERKGTVTDAAHVTGLDFTMEDKTPPVVALDAPAAKFGRRLVLDPRVSDDDTVRDLRVLIDGAEIAKITAAPFRIDVDVASLPRGKHRLELVATDASGNASAPVTAEITFIAPGTPPKVTLKGLAGGATLKKKTELTLTASDGPPVVSVTFQLDGKDLGAPRTKPP
jgi:uncharacterized protein (TIGR03790 family)